MRFLTTEPRTLFGMKVITSPLIPDEVPRIEVRDIKLRDGTSILTPAFRAEMNAWFLREFGTKQVAYIVGDQQMIAMSQRMKRALDREIERTLMGYPDSPRGAQ